MRILALCTSSVCLGLAHCPAVAADDANEIKQAIPADSAIMRADFEELARSPTAPNPSKLQDKSLTLMLLTLRVKDTKQARAQFQYLTENPPSPSTLSAELYRDRPTGKRRILLEPVTFLHANRITEFTCKVSGSQATGTVSFQAPQLYRGQVEYVAQRVGNKWFISEFILSAYDLHIVRAKDGRWKEKQSR